MIILLFFIFLSLNLYALDCVELVNRPLPINNLVQYQNDLWRCQQTVNVNPRLLGNTLNNWGMAQIDKVAIEGCREHFEPFHYSKEQLNKIISYSPSKFFNQEISYLLNQDEHSFESWADLMRIEAISNILNANCENTGKDVALESISNCERFSLGINNFKCSKRQKEALKSQDLTSLFEISKKLLELNKEKYKLLVNKNVLKKQIENQMKIAGQVLCGDKIEHTTEDIIYETYLKEFKHVSDRAKRIDELKSKKLMMPSSWEIDRELSALEYLVNYESNLNQLVADQLSKDPQLLILLEAKRDSLKQAENKIKMIEEKILLALSARPILFAGLDQHNKLMEQDLSEIYPLSTLKHFSKRPSDNELTSIFEKSANIINEVTQNSISKMCDANTIDLRALLSLQSVRNNLREKFPRYEALSICMEEKLKISELALTTTSVLGCTIGSIIPMTSLYSIGGCAGYFAGDSYITYLDSVQKFEFLADCRKNSTTVCTEKDYEKSLEDMKSAYQQFVFSLITDVGLEAVGVGALSALFDGVSHSISSTKKLFTKVQEATKVSNLKLRKKRFEEIFKRKSIAPIQNILLKEFEVLVKNLDPTFVRMVNQELLKVDQSLFKLLNTTDPVLARVLSEFYLQNIENIGEEFMMKILKASIDQKLSPTQFIKIVNYLEVATLKGDNAKENLARLLKIIHSTPSEMISRSKVRELTLETMPFVSPGTFSPEVILGKHGGLRQIFRYDNTKRYGDLNYSSIDKQGNFKFAKLTDLDFVSHGFISPQVWIDAVGEKVADLFLGIKKLGKNTYTIPDVSELNANLNRFNEIVGKDSELAIEMYFYNSPPVKSYIKSNTYFKNELSEVSQRTIDKVASGFGWPMGNRDLFHVHDVAAHVGLMLLDKKILQVAKTKAQDVVEFRAFIETLNIPQDIKQIIIYKVNAQAGVKFEEIGAMMNYLSDEDFSILGLENVNVSRQYFIDDMFENVIYDDDFENIFIDQAELIKIDTYISKLDDKRNNFTKKEMLKSAQKKLKIISKHFN